MATEETAGGARKATKSKLFEFLVHGVVSGAVRHSREGLRHASVRVRACWCVSQCSSGGGGGSGVLSVCEGALGSAEPCEGYFQPPGSQPGGGGWVEGTGSGAALMGCSCRKDGAASSPFG